MEKHEHDYKCVFSCHLPSENFTGTSRQRNPWSYTTMSYSAFLKAIERDLTKANGLGGLVKTETGYKSEHLLDSHE